MHKMKCSGAVIAAFLLLTVACLGERQRSVVFEEIGSFFDGGRPNGVWAKGDLIYVADGTDSLEILRFRVEE